MTPTPAIGWTELTPALTSKASRDAFVALARALAKVPRDEDIEDSMDDLRTTFAQTTRTSRRADRQALLAAGLVLADLGVQGWRLRVRMDCVQVQPPAPVVDDRAGEKARLRRQELVKRDGQLKQAAVQKFLRSVERPRLFDGRFVSIFSLMRDGRALAEGLRRARAHANNGWAGVLAEVTDPYLEFVTEDATCQFTGLRLMDVWRYFRHTWSNQYTSVPGRTMMFLVRDRAAPLHPVVGIGALSSPVMQIRERDTWIGWHPDTFLARVRAEPSRDLAAWLVGVVDAAVDEVYVADLLEDGLLSARDLSEPTDGVIERLLEESVAQRKLHHRYVRSRDHKGKRVGASSAEHWVAKARTHLFRSKRALALASYLRARAVLKAAFGRRPSAERLAELASTGVGSDVIRKVLKKAKGDRVGIAVADIAVCGAVQPYNAILGGKLVAMLAASPEVVREYRRRYSDAESEIASSMAGRPIVRAPTLVLLGTTSLYGVGSSQYNRIKVPCGRLGGRDPDVVRYLELGHSESFGTSQYSDATVEALADLVHQSEGGQRVNSIFGEGVSPKLRKVRQALDLLGLPSGFLLRHHRPRVVYAVSLVRNLNTFLLGLDAKPQYLIPLDSPDVTAQIAAWWRERWLHNRIASDDVLEEVSRHTLVHPIRHGARVGRPQAREQRELFAEPY
ncbi:MAG: DUF4338 domain-containing protein [Polyangiaceae bacterium]|nr:DUF4338 domain-containing protein [Polyangiaceae bacterium]